MKRPPIGILSKRYYDKFLQEQIEISGGICLSKIRTDRLIDLKGAIGRYIEAGLIVDTEWIMEYNDILRLQGVRDIKFTLK